ncbi:acetylcholinesterase-like [Solea senegalensis]|uniref:Carboxylic ester hydrolase n=1 Tax=Solea senegalensis TaxID=28829 RepID=A0AAV6Q1A5_SOLSE|nr:cholinesterase-like [Solea senegalensis]XP_043887327.1 cholinesterase-like [Solea senegalensis]KAG7479557.1 acetylcholinesterase-like [Solea senegalensis]
MATATLCTHAAFFLLLLLHFLAASPITQDDLLINTKHGKVQGKLVPVLGGHVRTFLGIPYGKPPLGKLRFKAPEPAEKWERVREATTFPASCHQNEDVTFPGFKGAEMWNPNTPQSEDCLYLNVWTPHFNKTQTPPPPLAPVLVWIYGGGFLTGTSSLDVYDGRLLSKSEGVVVVSMNYRVGVFGFLSLPDNKNIQGNAGLLDQRLAVQWVADNIAAFGGDPSKVTLFGESAGAASVGLHLLSPGSHRLFHRAVMESGSPTAPWAMVSRTESWSRALSLAKSLGCPTSNSAKLEACLQQVDTGKISSAISQPFIPIVDGNFLPDKPEVLLRTGELPKKDLLIGVNKDEGTYSVVYSVPGFSNIGPSLITRNQFLHGVNLSLPNASRVAREAVIFQYTDWTDVDNRVKNRDFLSSLNGDYLFDCPVIEFAQWYSRRGGKTFLYLFDHRSSVNPWPEWMGTMHGYEIEFVFGMPLDASLGYTKNEVNITKTIMKHWTNFARTGDPKIDGANWPVFTTDQQNYITLSSNPPQQKTMMKAQECQLWNQLVTTVQRVSDDLEACVNASGFLLCNELLLILLVIGLLVY